MLQSRVFIFNRVNVYSSEANEGLLLVLRSVRGPVGGQPVPKDAVRASLERLSATPLFSRSGRLSRFLCYVAEETLAGRGECIKEYTIGVEAYGKGVDFDPKQDATIRVEAG